MLLVPPMEFYPPTSPPSEGLVEAFSGVLSYYILSFGEVSERPFYSNAPMRSISTSFSVRNRQSPRRTFFFVRPANCTRSSLTTR